MKNILIIPLVLLVTACDPEPITQVDLSNYIQITKIITVSEINRRYRSDIIDMKYTIKGAPHVYIASGHHKCIDQVSIRRGSTFEYDMYEDQSKNDKGVLLIETDLCAMASKIKIINNEIY